MHLLIIIAYLCIERNKNKMERNVLKALQLCPLFEGFATKDIEQMMDSISYQLIKLDKKEVFLPAGTPCKFADIVISGEIIARMEGPSGKYMQITSRPVGSLLDSAFIFGKNNIIPVNMIASKPTTILRMTPNSMQMLLNIDERFRFNFIQLLSAFCDNLARKVRMLTLHTVREKVAIFLLEQSKLKNSDDFMLQKSRQEIAESFAIQKFSLQRCLKEFAADGVIKLNGKQIIILKREKLEALANTPKK
jgi:CRP-like cAMP-binding protein